jgi:hypothetical protein
MLKFFVDMLVLYLLQLRDFSLHLWIGLLEEPGAVSSYVP